MQSILLLLSLSMFLVSAADANEKVESCQTIFASQLKTDAEEILSQAFGGATFTSQERAVVTEKLHLLNSPEKREQIASNISGNQDEFFRGMLISTKTLTHILKNGMAADNRLDGKLYFGKWPATAGFYAISPNGVEPERNTPLLPVILRVNKVGTNHKIEDGSILTISGMLPASKITGVWILDTRPDGKEEFVDALSLIKN